MLCIDESMRNVVYIYNIYLVYSDGEHWINGYINRFVDQKVAIERTKRNRAEWTEWHSRITATVRYTWINCFKMCNWLKRKQIKHSETKKNIKISKNTERKHRHTQYSTYVWALASFTHAFFPIWIFHVFFLLYSIRIRSQKNHVFTSMPLRRPMFYVAPIVQHFVFQHFCRVSGFFRR